MVDVRLWYIVHTKCCPAVPYGRCCHSIQDWTEVWNFRDWSGLEKRPRSRNDTFAKTSARNNNNMCIWGRSEKKQQRYKNTILQSSRCILGSSEKLQQRQENYILQTKRSAEYQRPVIGTQSLTREYQSKKDCVKLRGAEMTESRRVSWVHKFEI